MSLAWGRGLLALGDELSTWAERLARREQEKIKGEERLAERLRQEEQDRIARQDRKVRLFSQGVVELDRTDPRAVAATGIEFPKWENATKNVIPYRLDGNACALEPSPLGRALMMQKDPSAGPAAYSGSSGTTVGPPGAVASRRVHSALGEALMKNRRPEVQHVVDNLYYDSNLHSPRKLTVHGREFDDTPTGHAAALDWMQRYKSASVACPRLRYQSA